MNFLPARLEGDTIKLPFGDAPLPDALRSRLKGDGNARDVIAGVRPEHFEDAQVEPDKPGVQVHGAGLGRRVDGLRALRVLRRRARRRSSPPSSTSWRPTRAWRTCRSTATASTQQVRGPARRGEPGARPGGQVEMVLDTSYIQLFDPSGGKSLLAPQEG